MQELDQAAGDVHSVEELEGAMLQQPQVECQITHHFGPDIYIREGVIPAGTLLIGHAHKTAHMNVILRGRVAVLIDGATQVIDGPAIFNAPVGRKVIYAIEDTVMQNIHATSETDIETLENQLVDKSDTWTSHELQVSTELLLEAAEEVA